MKVLPFQRLASWQTRELQIMPLKRKDSRAVRNFCLFWIIIRLFQILKGTFELSLPPAPPAR